MNFEVRTSKFEVSERQSYGSILFSLPASAGEMTVVPRAWRFRRVGLLVRMWRLNALPRMNLPVAVSGQVFVRVITEAGAIAVGDLLVSSSVAGVAMRGAEQGRLTGSVVGKALQPYAGQGESLIRMLVMVR